MKISILTPTRGRCLRAQGFAHSVLRTAFDPENIELHFYVDLDDPDLKQYQLWTVNKQDNIHIRFGPPISVSKSWNVIAEDCSGDILIMGNDDLVYHTLNWDNILHYKLMEYPDQIYVAWFRDGINGEGHCAFPIVSRKWYEICHQFTPGIFEFLYNDTWIYDIGLRLGRTLYIPEVYAEHEHFSTGKMQADETTIRPRRSGSTARDKILFEKTGAIREGHRLLLQEQIDNYKTK